jgi:hypothetical protein
MMMTKTNNIYWDSCRFVLVGGTCKAQCTGTPYTAPCIRNAAGKPEWGTIVPGSCTGPVPTPPISTCSGAPPASKLGTTIMYNWGNCKDLPVGQSCTGSATCTSGEISGMSFLVQLAFRDLLSESKSRLLVFLCAYTYPPKTHGSLCR